MVGRPSPAHRTRTRFRRALRPALALASAAGLLLGSFGPLEAALAAGESGPACCRGRCCCTGARPTDDARMKVVCHCGGDRRALVPIPALPDVDVARALALVCPRPEREERLAVNAHPRSHARPVPHPPPRLHLGLPSAV